VPSYSQAGRLDRDKMPMGDPNYLIAKQGETMAAGEEAARDGSVLARTIYSPSPTSRSVAKHDGNSAERSLPRSAVEGIGRIVVAGPTARSSA